MGRPSKAVDEKKKSRTISMTDTEWGNLDKMAKEAKMERSEFILKKLKIRNIPLP